MSISCDCSYDDGNRAAVEETVTRRARKPHKCCECGDTIPVGARYEHWSGCWEGHWERYRTCLTCVAIRTRYCPSGWLFGCVAEHIEHCIGFDYRFVPEGENES